MKRHLALHTGLLAAILTTAACGENLTATPPAPTGPTTLAPLLLPRVDGVWGGNLTLADITGGTGPARTAGILACGGATFQQVLGESNLHSLSIKQTGTDVTARLTSAGTGLACSYTGRVASNTLVLDAATCDAPALVFRCPNGEVVELDLVGSSITAALDAPVRVANLSGIAAHTYNVRGAGQDQGLVARHVFSSLTRQ